ncbi:PAS domain-containing protein [Pseudoalteromonas sp. MMG010]|uniref:methyl-accepting chemotaxis protein n=1 Tax=Pseudoalteromonas sp. MMG010 TaxID=2822685 RepID=UPI001B39EA33|nr:methyl-accepting chemotaxis protein [Pseudoalteromonas sp. MMG010]MBQ4834325.1 PAS domain-containing protein [Pseudoalteromonas sp. MMG010]
MELLSLFNKKKSKNDLIVETLQSSLAVIEFDKEGNILDANENFLTIFDYQLDEVIGQRHSLLIDSEDHNSSDYLLLWQQLASGELVAGQYKHLSRSGKELWLQVRYNPLLNDDGVVSSIIAFASEVTQQKQLAIEVEGQINAINKSQAVMEFSLDGTILAANDNFLSVFGYQLKDLLGQHHSSLVKQDFAESEEYKAFWQKLANGEFDSGEYLRIGKDDKDVWIQASYNPIFNVHGKPYKVIKYATDITAQKVLEQKSKEAADLANALKVCQANVMIADNELNIIFINDRVKTMLQAREETLKKAIPNFSVNELLGQSLDDFQHHPLYQRERFVGAKKPYQLDINLADLHFKLIISPWVNAAGKRLGTIVEWEDRTSEVAIENEIAELVHAAGCGDLDMRLKESGKSDFFLTLAKGLNSLVNIVDHTVSDMARMLDALARGDLSKRLEKDYQGSFDKLKQDANTTANKLTEVINQINLSASFVATGAQQISQGNADLNQRTEKQALSLVEAASSMEEMTNTVKQNADNAKIANQYAEQAYSKAIKGGEVVNKAVVSMSAINDSSNKISDIIGVIDDIAFQTNLLALNAAVEAARAGEQGRGFAVVAGEVRNLAQRSASAAKEIKSLIRDSVSKVADGRLLVNASGETLKEIVVSVQSVTQMIADIAHASQEQSAGIAQVNKAVVQMEGMTQQNAALVEQASAAGESMAEQAYEMHQLLQFFTVSEPMNQSTSVKAPLRFDNNLSHGSNHKNETGWDDF